MVPLFLAARTMEGPGFRSSKSRIKMELTVSRFRLYMGSIAEIAAAKKIKEFTASVLPIAILSL
jgi:hypothetical protein